MEKIERIYDEIDERAISEMVEIMRKKVGKFAVYNFNEGIKFEMLPRSAMSEILENEGDIIFDSLDIVGMSDEELSEELEEKILLMREYR